MSTSRLARAITPQRTRWPGMLAPSVVPLPTRFTPPRRPRPDPPPGVWDTADSPSAPARRPRSRWRRHRLGEHGQPPGTCRPGSPLPVLRLSSSLPPGQASTLIADVVVHLHQASGPVTAVILDLTTATGVGDDECAALGLLHTRLHEMGTELKIAAARPCVREQLSASNEALGAAAVHPSLRAAVLACYAQLPGPGLVTGIVRDALTIPATPLGQHTRPWDPVTATPLASLRTTTLTLGYRAASTASPAADGAP